MRWKWIRRGIYVAPFALLGLSWLIDILFVACTDFLDGPCDADWPPAVAWLLVYLAVVSFLIAILVAIAHWVSYMRHGPDSH